MFYGLGTACREVFGTVKGVEFGLLSKKSFDTYGPTFTANSKPGAPTHRRAAHFQARRLRISYHSISISHSTAVCLTPAHSDVLIWARDYRRVK
jgi:hypothetical protein